MFKHWNTRIDLNNVEKTNTVFEIEGFQDFTLWVTLILEHNTFGCQQITK